MNPFRLTTGILEAPGRPSTIRQPLRLGDKVLKNVLPRIAHISRPSSSANQSPVNNRQRPSLLRDPVSREPDVFRKEARGQHSPAVFRSPQSHLNSMEREELISPKSMSLKPVHRRIRSDQVSNVVVMMEHPGRVNKVPIRKRSGSIEMPESSYKLQTPKNTARFDSPPDFLKPPPTLRNKSTPKTKRLIIKVQDGKNKATDTKSQELSTSSTEKFLTLNTSESIDEEEKGALVQFISENFKTLGECPGSTLDFYRVGKLIGKGAFGKVISATHKLSGLVVAMKTIERAYLADERHRRKVLQEVSILQRISHKRVIKILEVFESAHHLLIVMEYAGGGDLLQYVKGRGKLSEEETRHLFRQIVEGAVAIHDAGVLHRDFKLDNILLDSTRRKVKICDFGVSRLIKKGQRINEQCGTPAYIAPEIIADRGYEGFTADTWSLGVCLYAMLNGMVPFKAQTLKDLHKLILTAKYVLPESMSVQAKDLVTRMLQLVPNYRIPLEEVLTHAWMNPTEERQSDVSMSFVAPSQEFGFPKTFTLKSLEANEMNHATASYYLLHDSLY